MLDEPAYLARLPGWSGLPARYTPLEVIGEGSYGKVCLADDGIMGEQVAIKKVVDVFCNTGDARRILREIKILRNLRHDNIIPIMDIITPTDENNFEDLLTSKTSESMHCVDGRWWDSIGQAGA